MKITPRSSPPIFIVGRFRKQFGSAWLRTLRAWSVLWVGLPATALAQPTVPPEAIDQFNQTIGQRVEAVTVLGGDQGAMRGIYTFRGGHLADLSVTKIGGRGELATARPLGGSRMKWAPMGQINYGHIVAENEFRTGYLQGNRSEYDVLALQAGGGARFYFNDHLSLAPALAGIYGHTENEFKPRNAVGDAVKAACQRHVCGLGTGFMVGDAFD